MQLYWNKKNDRDILKDSFLQNLVGLGTSDTVLGLLAPLTRQGCVSLNTIKGRERKPYIVLIGSHHQIKQFCVISAPMEPIINCLIEKCWPGPLTLICKARQDLPDYLVSQEGTIALRVPQHAGLLSLLSDPEIPGLFSTSANKAGEPVPERLQDVHPQLLTMVDHYILDAQEKVISETPVITETTKKTEKSLPSTILDCSKDEGIFVIREGAYSVDTIKQICPSISSYIII